MLAESLSYIAPDAIFALTIAYNNDKSAHKVNLGQGTYKDENGEPFVLSAVKLAKERLKDVNHEYLPILGLPAFRITVVDLLFGQESQVDVKNKIACSQALSGTGALHAAGTLLRKAYNSPTTVYITEPSWTNHRAVFETVGFPVTAYRYVDQAGIFDFAALTKTLEQAETGSIFVFHACGHNPCACDPSRTQWKQIAAIMSEKQLFPIFDAAYLGLTSGDFDHDAWAIRYFIDEMKMEAAVCLSFAKNMGLYGERVGAVMFSSESAEGAAIITSQLEQMQRAEISNPPAFGARIVSQILQDPDLTKLWMYDLERMSARLKSMRHRLCKELTDDGCPQDFSHIAEQVGMFSMLGLHTDQVQVLKEKYHIYMPDSSRISIAGLNEGNVAYVARAITKVIRGEE